MRRALLVAVLSTLVVTGCKSASWHDSPSTAPSLIPPLVIQKAVVVPLDTPNGGEPRDRTQE